MSALSRRSALALGMTLLLSARAPRAQATPAPASQAVRAIVGGKLLRPGQPPLEGASITIAEGKIVSVGTGGALPAAEDVIDATGKLVSAGLSDLLTSVGLVEIGLEKRARDDAHASSDLVRSAFLAADGYNPDSSLIAVTRREGVTSVGVVPHGGLVPGQSAWADLDGDSQDAALAERRIALHVLVDDARHGGGELNRGTALLRLRELFEDARAFKRSPAQFERRQLRHLSASRLDLMAVSEALDGRLPVVFHVDRASDIVAALRVAKLHKLRPILASAAEGWKVAREIASAGAPVVVYPLDNSPRSFAALGARDDNAALLVAAGARVTISSGETHNARKLRQVAGNAIRAGLSYDAALSAVTLEPARAVGLDARYGSVEPGRVANLVVWSGDPFELSTRAEAVVIRGRSVSLRSRQTALFERYR
jgi:imidazolonepropionase-like amidohydrolase